MAKAGELGRSHHKRADAYRNERAIGQLEHQRVLRPVNAKRQAMVLRALEGVAKQHVLDIDANNVLAHARHKR